MPSKRKVLYLITRSDLGGAQKHLSDLMKYSNDKYEIHLAIGSVGYLTEIANSLNIQVHIISSLMRSINIMTDIKALKEFTVLVKNLKPDLIHAHSSKPGAIARISGKLHNVPVLFTVHGWGFDEKAPFIRRTIALLVEKLMSPLTTKIICVCKSDYIAAIDLGIFKKEKAVVIYNSSEDIDLIPAKPEQNPPRLIMVARFDNKQKDQLGLVSAMAKLEDDISLDFVGSGEDFEIGRAHV